METNWKLERLQNELKVKLDEIKIHSEWVVKERAKATIEHFKELMQTPSYARSLTTQEEKDKHAEGMHRREQRRLDSIEKDIKALEMQADGLRMDIAKEISWSSGERDAAGIQKHGEYLQSVRTGRRY